MHDDIDPRLTPLRGDCAAATLQGSVAARRFVSGTPMTIAVEAEPLRVQNVTEGPIDTQALFGEAIRIYEHDGDGRAWGQLARDSYVGYVRVHSLAATIGPPTHHVRVPRSFVYPRPDMKQPPTMALPFGAQCRVLDQDGVFSQMAEGYVWTAHLAATHAHDADYVAVAEQFLHAPYLWGGKTWAGIDCSGLVQVALQAAGHEAPRDTDLMVASLGRDLAIDEALSGLQRGDLVFWPGHVGILCDGETVLHASGHHMQVVREPLFQARDRIRAGGTQIKALRRVF